MATLEVTAEGLREVVDEVKVQCDSCRRARARKVLRCRTYRVAAAAWCVACLAELEDAATATVLLHGHMHCRACNQAGEQLSDVLEIFDL